MTETIPQVVFPKPYVDSRAPLLVTADSGGHFLFLYTPFDPLGGENYLAVGEGAYLQVTRDTLFSMTLSTNAFVVEISRIDPFSPSPDFTPVWSFEGATNYSATLNLKAGYKYYFNIWPDIGSDGSLPSTSADITFKPLTFEVTSNPLEITENSTSGNVTVTLSSPSPADAPVNVHVDLGPANWQSDVSLLRSSFTIPAGYTTLTVPVISAPADDVLEPIEPGTLVFSATAGSTALTSETGDNTVPLHVKDALTLPEGLSAIEAGITRAKDFTNNFKVTVEVLESVDPTNPKIVHLKQVLKITGKALDGALIVETFVSDVSTLRDAASVRAAADQLYTAGENATLSTIDKFLLKPAVLMVASASVAEAGLGVGILTQALGMEVAVGAALLLEGSLGMTVGLGIAAATTVAAAAAPLLVVAAAGWLATAAYGEFAPRAIEELRPGLELGRSSFVDAVEGAFATPIRVLDGYISAATVFSDDNGNGVLDPGEAFAATDPTGEVVLARGTGPLIAFGGTDTSTGLAFKGQLSAPAGSKVITPLTTLFSYVGSDPSGEQKLLAGLGLSPALQLTALDPVAAAKVGDITGAAAQVASAKSFNTVFLVASALAGAGGSFEGHLQKSFSILASALAGSGFNLTDKSAVTSLINDILQLEQLGPEPNLVEALSEVIVATNAALDHAREDNQDGNELLLDVAAIELVVQGKVSTAFSNVATHPDQLAGLASQFTGDNLSQLVTIARPLVQLLTEASTVVSIEAIDAVKAEGNGATSSFTFVVSQLGDLSLSHTVGWSLSEVGGHAASGSDFEGDVLPFGTLTFAPGENSQTINVPVAGDTIVEFDEFFTVTLSNPSAGLSLGTASAVGIIQNDDRATISIVALAAVKVEGNSGTTAFTFMVSLDQPSVFGTQTADWSVTGSDANPANAADFGGTLPSGTVSFAAGETSQVVTVLVTGDTAVELDEDFTVTLSNPTFGLLLGMASATGTILNDDGNVVSIAALSAAKGEGDAGTTPFTFTVTLNEAGLTVQTVDWTVAGVAPIAADGADFGSTLPTGTVTFAPGETSQIVTVSVSGDTTVEPDNFFTVTLSNPTAGLSLGPFVADAIIQNDDRATISIVPLAASRPEGNSGSTSFTFTVSLDQAPFVGQGANWTVLDLPGAGANAADFGGALPFGTVSFAPGETSKVVTVSVSGDTTVEADEGFTVALTAFSTGIVPGAADSANATIENDDRSIVSIAALSAAKAEGDSGTTAFTFTVSLDQAALTSQTMSWAVTGSGANPADTLDFAGGVLPGGAVTFAAGEISKTVTVAVAGDVFVEASEDFTVTLSAPSAGLTLGTATATGTIQNDDSTPVSVTAHDDAYIVLEGQSLTIATASGVLFNDQSASSASPLASAGHGAMQLASSGGFTYMPATGFTGIDSFTYHAVPGGNGVGGKATLYVVAVNAGASTTLDLLGLTAAEQIAATYTAFFGRAADAGGHGFWVGQFVQNLPSQGAAALFANIASSFGISAEAKALYPFLVSPFTASDGQISAFLDSVYNNLFNRSSDAGGLAYWTGQIKATLQAGQFVGSVLVNIMSGAQDTAAGKDITTLMSKVAVSLEYVHEQEAHGTVWAGASDVAFATNLLRTVTSDATSVLIGIRNAEEFIAAHA